MTKYRKIIIFTLVILLIIIIVIFLNRKKDIKTNEGEFTVNPIYNGIEVGEATRDDIINKLGNPIIEYYEDSKKYIEYNSLNPNFNDQFVVVNDKLDFIRDIITINEDIRINDLINKYRKADFVLYGPGSGIGIHMYVYPKKGIAYLGHEKSGYLTEIWYFKPTTIEEFIKNKAQGYSLELNEIQ